ncbi:MAG: VWA domain-containing protein [Bacteroidetes bacterium]|nr:VWA domain-containing protein [Bacteroidota bacterium]
MKRSLLYSFLLILVVASAVAQPRIELRHMKPNTPDYYYYQLYIATYCGDSVFYYLQKHHLIYEETNGRIDTNAYSIDRRASPTRNSCYDLALVLDNSSTISADDLGTAVDALRAYVDTMSQDCQRAAVVNFADRPTLRSFLTSDTAVLHSALDGMNPGGRRSLYDAILTGMVELSTNGISRLKVILALTTGNDNASGATIDYLKETARRDDIRLFIIGLGSQIWDPPLRELCVSTGGLYYAVPDAAALPDFYVDLAGFIQREFDEHRIVRRTPDVIMKDLLIRMRLEACDDSIWTQRLFNPSVTTTAAPLSPVSFRLGQTYPNPVSRGADVQFTFDVAAATQLPLRLQLHDRLGRQVALVFEKRFTAGSHRIRWSPSALSPGVYFYRLSSGMETVTGRMTVIP